MDRGTKSLPRSGYKKSCLMAAVVMVVTTYSNDIRTRDNLLVKCMILDSTCISDLFNHCLVVISIHLFPTLVELGLSLEKAQAMVVASKEIHMKHSWTLQRKLEDFMTARNSVSHPTNALGAQSIKIDWPSARNDAVTECRPCIAYRIILLCLIGF